MAQTGRWQDFLEAKHRADRVANDLGRGKLPHLGRRGGTASLGVVVLVALCLGAFWVANRAAVPHYSVSVSGTVPAVETVGEGFSVPITVANTGRAVPGIILDVAGCTDHWVLNGVRPAGQSSGSYYEVGSLQKHGRLAVSVDLVPRDAGNHACRLKMWQGTLSHGVPSGDELASLSTTVAIDP